MKNFQKIFFVKVGLIVMVALFIFGTGLRSSYAAEKVQVLIGTAAIGAAFYPVGVAMAEVINKNLPGYIAIAQTTGGSVANVRLIGNKQLTLGFGNLEFGIAALKGEKPFDKVLNVLPVMHLGMFPQTFLTLKKTGIKTMYDCKGKRIAIGTPGASVNVSAKLILKLHGIGENDFKPFYMGYSESGDALGDGVIDVMIDPGVMPSPTTDSLYSTRNDIWIVEQDPEILRKSPQVGWVEYKVPNGIYKGFNQDVAIFSVRALIYANGEEKDKVVNDLVKVTLSHKDVLKAAHALGAQLDYLRKKDADKYGLKIHPGAIQASKNMGEWEK